MTQSDTPTQPASLGDDADVRFEVLVRRLEEIVGRLEVGEQSLETALDDFEMGMTLSAQATTILDSAEERVERLLSARDGEFTEAPFAGAA